MIFAKPLGKGASPMKAAIYARFSSDNQREQSIDDQIRVCKNFATQHNFIVLDTHVYVDEAKSGTIHNRAGLGALQHAAEAHLFTAVIVDDASRLSRDNHHFNTLLCLFQYWDINLISASIST